MFSLNINRYLINRYLIYLINKLFVYKIQLLIDIDYPRKIRREYFSLVRNV